MTKELIEKSFKALRKRKINKELIHYGISKACRVLGMNESVYYYKGFSKDDRHIEEALKKKVGELRKKGFRRLRPVACVMKRSLQH